MRNGNWQSPLLIMLFLWVSVTVYAQPENHTNTEVAAKIEIKGFDDIANVEGLAVNNTDFYKSLRYKISLFVTDAETGNLNKNERESEFSLEPNQTLKLASLTVNLNTKNKIVILLLIYEDDTIVGVSRVAYNEPDKNGKLSTFEMEAAEAEKVEEEGDGVEIRGIVVDETKTKFGRDFYEYFFYLYNTSGINGDKIVKVFEKFGRARTTIIEVSVEGEKVNEFITRPKDDYLQAMAQNSLRLVFRHFKNLERQQEYIRY